VSDELGIHGDFAAAAKHLGSWHRMGAGDISVRDLDRALRAMEGLFPAHCLRCDVTTLPFGVGALSSLFVLGGG
jgi:hypothetical protein